MAAGVARVRRVIHMVANSASLLSALLLTEFLVAALLYMVAEGKGFWDSIWWSVVTGATVGYGDTYPVTPLGRVVGGTLILTSVLLVIPLIVAHFAARLIVDRDTFSHEEQEEIKLAVRRIEALLLAERPTEPAQQSPPSPPRVR